MPTANEISVLKAMYQACGNIIAISTDFVNANDLTDKDIVFDNVYMNLVIISEAYIKISQQTKDKYDIIRWEDIKNYTQDIVNDYQQIDVGKIVAVCKYLIPSLSEKLKKILNQNS